MKISWNVSAYGTIDYQHSTPAFPFSTKGKKIVDRNGETIFLQGVNKMGFEYNNPATSPIRETDPAYFTKDAERIADWGCNFVRLGFNAYWYETDPEYRAIYKQLVDTLAEFGIYCLIDLHWWRNPDTDTIESLSAMRVPEGQANTIAEYFNTILEMAAVDFLDQPYVIGVTINEFTPIADMNTCWRWLFDMNNRLAQRIHAVNPNLLIFANMEEWVLVYSDYTDIIEECATAPMEPNIVFDSHHYCAEVPEGILHPEGPSGWLPENCGWDYYEAYLTGRYAEAREKVDRWFNLTYLWIQQLYDVPIIIGEFGMDRQVADPAIQDFVQYFKNNGWSFAYWVYYGADADELQMLMGDWATLTPQGECFVSSLV